MPDLATIRRFAARGAIFSFGSDGHGPEGVGNLAYCREVWAAAGLPADRLLAPPVFASP